MTAHATPSSCIFCRIGNGELEASLIHQDEQWLVLMDIHPVRDGHVLIVPRRHVARMHELDPDARAALVQWADTVLRAQEALGLSSGGANLLLNDGVAGDQHIPHLHLHCIPRRRGDRARVGLGLLRRMFGMFGGSAPRARLDDQAAQLRRALTAPSRQ